MFGGGRECARTHRAGEGGRGRETAVLMETKKRPWIEAVGNRNRSGERRKKGGEADPEKRRQRAFHIVLCRHACPHVCMGCMGA